MEKFINRIGTVKNCFDIEIVVHSLELTLNEVTFFKVTWERGNKCCETKEFVVSPTIKTTSIEHTLFMSNTIYQKGSEYLQKQAKIKLKQKINQEWISISFITLDLSIYIDKPILRNQFILDFQGHQSKLCISITTHKSVKAGGELTISKSISEVNSKYDSIYSLLVSTLQETTDIKNQIKSCEQEIHTFKNDTNEELLKQKNKIYKQELEQVKRQLDIEKDLKLKLEGNLLNVETKVAESIKEHTEEKEINEISGRLKDIIKRHTIYQK